MYSENLAAREDYIRKEWGTGEAGLQVEEEGNVEYKLKLVNPTVFRVEHLVTQLKWRLEEGQGETIYNIGVEDNGLPVGLTDIELQASLHTLDKMADRLGATLTNLCESVIESETGGEERKTLEVLVRKVPDDQKFIDLRLAMLGNVHGGKSTLLGVLLKGELDDGHGKARKNLSRHLSCEFRPYISHEIMGFNNEGELMNYCGSRSAKDICERSSKLITLIDLATYHEHLTTTTFGLTHHSPDYSMLVISANKGLACTAEFHFGFALAFNVPIFVVVTKIDLCDRGLIERTISQLEKMMKLRGCKKIPVRVSSEDDAITAAQNFDSDRIVPIFAVSSVTGQNMELLLKFLNVIPAINKDKNQLVQRHAEYQIDEVFSVPGVGTVVDGKIHSGSIQKGDQLMLGPFEDGQFQKVSVKTVRRHGLPCQLIKAGQASTIALANVETENLRKGMVLVNPELECACLEFEADIFVLYHDTQICKGFQTTIHIGNVCQTVEVVRIEGKDSVKTNQKVVFQFVRQPEYIRVGCRLLFQQGITKGVGEVIEVYPYSESPSR